MDPAQIAMLACTAYATQQTTFFMYHYNSYAANPIMLRSPKPQVMRDFFLVPCNLGSSDWYRFLNPLPGVYVFSFEDAMANSAAMGLVGYPLIKTIGLGHVSAVYALGSIFSGFAYVFQMQCSKTKKSTEFDCAASSQGAVAALCSLSFLVNRQVVPGTKRFSTAPFAAAFLLRSLVEEYGLNPLNTAAYHKWFRTSALSKKSASGGENMSGSSFFREANPDWENLEEKYFDEGAATRSPKITTSRSAGTSTTPMTSQSQWAQSADQTGHIELTNWGSIGGIFLGLIYGSLVIGVKKDFGSLGRFWSRMPKGGQRVGNAAATSNSSSGPTKPPPPPSWGKP